MGNLYAGTTTRTIVLGSIRARLTEGQGIPTLVIWRSGKNGQKARTYRGSSLRFSDPLTEADKRYLISLIS